MQTSRTHGAAPTIDIATLHGKLKLARETLNEYAEAHKLLKANAIVRVRRRRRRRGRVRLQCKALQCQLDERVRQDEAERSERLAELLRVDCAALVHVEALEDDAPALNELKEAAELVRVDGAVAIVVEHGEHAGARVAPKRGALVGRRREGGKCTLKVVDGHTGGGRKRRKKNIISGM